MTNSRWTQLRNKPHIPNQTTPLSLPPLMATLHPPCLLPTSPSPMSEPRSSADSSSSSSVLSFLEEPVVDSPMIARPGALTTSLVNPSRHRRRRPRIGRMFRTLCRTLPIFTPKCAIPAGPCKLALPGPDEGGSTVLGGGQRSLSGTRITGTLFGYRKGRISLSVQETPQCVPSLIFELAIPTHVLMRDMSSGMVRIALECEKTPEHKPGKLLSEPLWTMFCNGKKSGYGLKREMSEEDLAVMEVLKAVSMGAGVLPGKSEAEGPDGEMAYMRAHFEHVVGSRDSETLYMLGPDMTNGPELTIFFIRI